MVSRLGAGDGLRLTATGAAAAEPLARDRAELVERIRLAARLALAGAIVLSPFHARIVLDARPLPPVFHDYRDLMLFWNEILVIAVLALWALSLVIRPRKLDLGPLLLRLPVVALLIAIWLSVPFSVEPVISLFNAVVVLGFIALGMYVLNEIEDLRQLVPAVVLMVVIQAVVGITQVVSQASFGLSALGELDLDPTVSGVSIVWAEDAARQLRAYGLSDHPNILGGVLAFALLLVGTGLSRYRGNAVTLLSASFGVGVAALLVTFSRSGALALLFGLGLTFALLLARRHRQALGLWATACLVAVVVAVPLVRPYADYLSARTNPTAQQAGSTEERALSERRALVRNTNEIFIDHPIVGVGLSALPTAMYEAFPEFGYHHSPAHIVILTVAAETGILGAAAYGLLMVAPWLLLYFYRRRLTPELIGVSAALLAVTVVGLLDYYTWSLTPGRFWFWLVLGLWVLSYRRALDGRCDA